MLTWLKANLLTIVVALILLGVVVLILRRLALDKRAGKHICGGSCGSCGGGCGSCPMQGKCHQNS